MDIYTLDKCSICGKYKALKNGVCSDCADKDDMPEFLKDLFKGIKE
jgi:ribosomal protein L32